MTPITMVISGTATAMPKRNPATVITAAKASSQPHTESFNPTPVNDIARPLVSHEHHLREHNGKALIDL